MHDYWDHGWHMGWMPGGWIAFAILLAALSVTAAAVARRAGNGESPELILRRRYAGGEITREEFERALQDLRAESRSTQPHEETNRREP